MLKLLDAFVPPVHRVLHGMPGLFPDDASGTVTAHGGSGDWTMHVNACQSGEYRQFFGVTFFDESQAKLGGRLVLPVEGDQTLLVNTPARGGSDEVRSGACQVWDVDLQRTGTSYNRIVALQGHARFDCRLSNPEARLVGDLRFRSCH